MTQDEIQIATNLYACTMLPGTFDKRFVTDMYFRSKQQEPKPLSDKQNEILYRLVYKYRKQIPHTYEKYKNNIYCQPKPKEA